MVTIVLKLRLELSGVRSLKEKRRILKSLLTRIRNDFNVSVAEVGDNDRHRTASLAAAIVTNDSGYGHEVLAKVVNRIEGNPDVILADYGMESY